MENSHLGLDEGQFSLPFKWTDSTSLWLAQKDPLVATLLDEMESSLGLSREQSSSSAVHTSFLSYRRKPFVSSCLLTLPTDESLCALPAIIQW